MIRMEISFDDSFVDQLKWARTMGRLGLVGTFYISPGRLGKTLPADGIYYLTESHVEQIASMGHLIGNHTWDHEAPATEGVDAVMDSILKAKEWLDARGFFGHLLALPYGVRGGQWTRGIIEELQEKHFVLRDVLFKDDESRTPNGIPAALESTTLEFSQAPMRYFHGNNNTKDDEMAEFLYGVAEAVAAGEVEVVTPLT